VNEVKVSDFLNKVQTFSLKEMEYNFFEMITSPDFDLNQIVKRGIMFKAASAKISNPKETKKNIAKSLNVSERTLQRYANDLNFTSFKKNKATTHVYIVLLLPKIRVKCLYCSFIAKNKSGLAAHTRSKHLEALAKITQNRTNVSENTKDNSALLKNFSNKKREPLKKTFNKKEELGLGKEEEEETPVNVLDFLVNNPVKSSEN
jgi:hypothetical protein